MSLYSRFYVSLLHFKEEYVVGISSAKQMASKYGKKTYSPSLSLHAHITSLQIQFYIKGTVLHPFQSCILKLQSDVWLTDVNVPEVINY